MTWRGIIIGAVAGFAWLLLLRVAAMAGIVNLSGDDAVWLALGGLAAVWLMVVWLVNRMQGGG